MATHSSILAWEIGWTEEPDRLQSMGSWKEWILLNNSKETSGLIFRMDWLDLLAVQGTLKSLLQHYSSKASILWHSAFFTVQLSHPYMATGRTIALTRRTFVGKVMSLLVVLNINITYTKLLNIRYIKLNFQIWYFIKETVLEKSISKLTKNRMFSQFLKE